MIAMLSCFRSLMLMTTGSLGMAEITSVFEFPTNYRVVLQNNSFPVMIENFAASRCATLASAPLFLDQRFWCAN